MKKENGITLVALVITIIVLLILAGITISLTLGQNGIIQRAQESAIDHLKAEIKQEIELAILEIEMDLKSNNAQKNLSNDSIIESLPNKLQNILINEDLTGEYRDYEYWIDEEYKVHVEGKTNNPIKIQVVASYIGTSSCTIKVDASSTQGNIVGYKYKINDEQTEQLAQSEYTIEELEPSSKYTISVEVTDEKGNTRTSIPYTITTKERTYIIKDGVQQINGNVAYATMTQENGYLNVAINSTSTIRAGYYTINDLSKYKTIKVDVEVVKKESASSGSLLVLAIFKEDINQNEYDKYEIIANHSENNKGRATYSMDVTEFEGNRVISCIKNHTATAASAEINIYNLWLEE